MEPLIKPYLAVTISILEIKMELPFKADKEREKLLIEKLAKLVVDYGMEDPAIMALEMLKPTSFLGGQLVLTYFTPFISILGVSGYELSALFSDRENLVVIKEKIEELEKVRSAESKIQREKEKEQITRPLNFNEKFHRFTRRIFGRSKG